MSSNKSRARKGHKMRKVKSIIVQLFAASAVLMSVAQTVANGGQTALVVAVLLASSMILTLAK